MKEEKHYWLGAIKFIIMPLYILLCFSGLYNYINETIIGTEFEYTFFTTRYVIISAIFLIYSIIIYILIFKKVKFLPNFITMFFIITSIYFALNYAGNFAQSEIEIVIIFLIFIMLFSLCWILPNYIYFNHRKALFKNEFFKNKNSEKTQLQNLNDLYNNKLISKSEYEELRQEILKKII